MLLICLLSVSTLSCGSKSKLLCSLIGKTNALLSRVGAVEQSIDGLADQLQVDCTGGCSQNVVLLSQADIPYVITSAGHYCLVEDVSTNGNAITLDLQSLAAQSVTIDLNGYTISGFQNGSIQGRNGIVTTIAGGTNAFPIVLTIKNGIITAMQDHGIEIAVGVTSLTIDSVAIIQAGQSGALPNEAGILVGSKGNRSQNPLIINSQVYGFPGSTGRGIYLLNCANYTISNTLVKGVGLDGIRVSSAADIESGTITDVVVSETGGSGIYLELDEDNTIIRDAVCIKNSENGFTLLGNNYIVQDCAAVSNLLDGFTISGAQSHLSSNVAITNGQVGFNSSSRSGTNYVYSNFASGNGSLNYSVDITNVQNSPVPSDPINFTTNIAN